MFIEELTWPEVEKLFKKGVAIIPIGATEQHGPHLPMGSDSFYAEEYAKRVGKKLNIPVCPTVSCSVSGLNFPYPTLTIEPETLTSYLKDICKSLKFFGVKKIIFIVGHGGENASAIDTAEYIIARDVDIKIRSIYPWQFLPEKEYKSMDKDWHAGRIETSDMLYLKEDLVRKSKIKRSDVPRPMKFTTDYRKMKKDKRQGVLGDASKASKELGKKNFETAVKKMTQEIQKLLS